MTVLNAVFSALTSGITLGIVSGITIGGRGPGACRHFRGGPR